MARIKTHTHNVQYLLLFHGKDGYANVPHCYTGVLINPQLDQEGNKLQRPNSNFCKPLRNNSEGCPSNQVSTAAMSSASDEKWRPYNCFFSQVRLKTYQHPCTTHTARLVECHSNHHLNFHNLLCIPMHNHCTLVMSIPEVQPCVYSFSQLVKKMKIFRRQNISEYVMLV